MKHNKALFLDRDGIINEDIGYAYKPQHIKFIPDIFKVCKIAQQYNYKIIVATNQSGIAKGLYTSEEVVKLHEWMSNEFLKRDIAITAFYYCPFHIDATVEMYRIDSLFRKPGPGMFLIAAAEHSILLKNSIMVGDKPSDRIIDCFGMKSIIVKSKYTDDNYDVESLIDVVYCLTDDSKYFNNKIKE